MPQQAVYEMSPKKIFVCYLLWNCTHLYSFFMVRLIYFIQTTHYKSLEFAVDGENKPEIEKKLFLFRRLDKTLL